MQKPHAVTLEDAGSVDPMHQLHSRARFIHGLHAPDELAVAAGHSMQFVHTRPGGGAPGHWSSARGAGAAAGTSRVPAAI